MIYVCLAYSAVVVTAVALWALAITLQLGQTQSRVSKLESRLKELS